MEKKVKCEVSRCECGRINVCREDERKHIKETGHQTRERMWKEKNEELQVQIGMIILAEERGYIFI